MWGGEWLTGAVKFDFNDAFIPQSAFIILFIFMHLLVLGLSV